MIKKNTAFQNVYDTAKELLREKFIPLNTYTRKEETFVKFYKCFNLLP